MKRRDGLTCPRPTCGAHNYLSASYCSVCGSLLGVIETKRERRARRHAEAQREARRLVSQIVAERPVTFFGLCEFCGGPSIGPACTAHKDLLDLDPYKAVRSAREEQAA